MPNRPQALLRTLLLAAAGSLLLLAALTALDRTLDWPATQHLDHTLQQAVHAWTSPGLTTLMLTLTWVGAIKFFLPATTLWIGILASRGRRREAATLAGAIVGAVVLNETLKLHFHRMRPAVPWSIGDEPTFSFPSGHTLFAVVLYGTLAWLATQRGQRGPILFAIVMPIAIGLSRIYLGMHYPTDVLAGYLAGALWLGTVILIAKRTKT